jgi:hypothetical protein
MKLTRRLEEPVLQDCPLERFDFQIDPYRGAFVPIRLRAPAGREELRLDLNDLQQEGPSHLSIHVQARRPPRPRDGKGTPCPGWR